MGDAAHVASFEPEQFDFADNPLWAGNLRRQDYDDFTVPVGTVTTPPPSVSDTLTSTATNAPSLVEAFTIADTLTCIATNVVAIDDEVGNAVAVTDTLTVSETNTQTIDNDTDELVNSASDVPEIYEAEANTLDTNQSHETTIAPDTDDFTIINTSAPSLLEALAESLTNVAVNQPPLTPAPRSSTQAAFATDSHTATIATPAGVVEGDLIVLFISWWFFSPPTTITPPTGFTAAVAYDGGGSSVYYKFASSAEPSSYTFTWSGGDASRGGIIAGAYSNVYALDQATRHYDSDTSNGVTATGFTTNYPDELLVAFFRANGSIFGSWTPPTGFTERRDFNIDFGNLTMSMDDKVQHLPGDTAGGAVQQPQNGLLDSFNRANENPLSNAGKWSKNGSNPSAALAVVSNQVQGFSNTIGAFWNFAQFASDQEAYLTLSTLPAAGEHVGVLLNFNGTAGSDTWTGYLVAYDVDSGGSPRVLVQAIDSPSTITTLATYSVAFNAGDKLLAQYRDGVIYTYRYHSGTWTLLGSIADTTYQQIGNIGIRGLGTTWRVDDFGGGDVVGPVTATYGNPGGNGVGFLLGFQPKSGIYLLEDSDLLDTLQQTNIPTLVEVLSDLLSVVQTLSNTGTIAEVGETFDVSATADHSISEALKETLNNLATLVVTMDTVGDESEPLEIIQTLVTILDDFVVGAEIEIRRQVQQLIVTLDDSIIIDIDTLTIVQTNLQSIIEDIDDLIVSQTMTFSMDEQIPQTVETRNTSQTNVQSLVDDELIFNSATNLQSLLENSELSNAVETNVPSIVDIIVTPGSGFNEDLLVVETNVPRITEIISTAGPDTLDTFQTNVPRISERILSPPTPQADSNGIEFSRVILPYSPLTVPLANAVAPGATSWQLSGSYASLPTAHFILEIGDEIVYVVSRFGSQVIVIRGWSLTTPTSHSAGATVTWPTHYDMAFASPIAALPGDWLTFFDATQAYLDGQRYAFHVEQILSVGKTTAAQPNKLDGPQPWRASPIVGVTERVPGGVCQPARLLAAMNIGDRIVVRYNNTVAPSGVFELGPREVMFMLWGGNIQTAGTVTPPPGGNLYEMSGLFTDTDPQAGGINMTYYAQRGYRWISYQAVNGGTLKNPDLTAAKAAGFDPNVGAGVWGVVYDLSDFHAFGVRLGSQAVALGAQHVIVDAEIVYKNTRPGSQGAPIIQGIRDGGWTGPVHLSTLGAPSDPIAFDFAMDTDSFLATGGGVLPQAYSNETDDYDPINCKTYWTRFVPAGKLNYTIGLYSGALGRFSGTQEVALLNAAGVNRNLSIFLAETALLADVTALEYFTAGAATNDPTGTSGATNNAFLRFDAAGNLDMTNPNAFIYDGKSTINMAYANSAGLIRATEFGADRYWTIPIAEGGKGKSGLNLGILVLRNGFSDIPIWASPDWRNGDYQYMGFDDPDAMFMQVVYRYHITPASDDVYGPNATWTEPDFETSTAFAMFTVPAQFIPVPGTGHPGPTDPGGGGGGGGIFKPPPVTPLISGHQVLIVKLKR